MEAALQQSVYRMGYQGAKTTLMAIIIGLLAWNLAFCSSGEAPYFWLLALLAIITIVFSVPRQLRVFSTYQLMSNAVDIDVVSRVEQNVGEMRATTAVIRQRILSLGSAIQSARQSVRTGDWQHWYTERLETMQMALNKLVKLERDAIIATVDIEEEVDRVLRRRDEACANATDAAEWRHHLDVFAAMIDCLSCDAALMLVDMDDAIKAADAILAEFDTPITTDLHLNS